MVWLGTWHSLGVPAPQGSLGRIPHPALAGGEAGNTDGQHHLVALSAHRSTWVPTNETSCFPGQGDTGPVPKSTILAPLSPSEAPGSSPSRGLCLDYNLSSLHCPFQELLCAPSLPGLPKFNHLVPCRTPPQSCELHEDSNGLLQSTLCPLNLKPSLAYSRCLLHTVE